MKTSLGKNYVSNIDNEHNKENEIYYLLMDSLEIVECFLTFPNKECYLNLPTWNTVKSPLNFENTKEKQLKDAELIKQKENIQSNTKIHKPAKSKIF